MYNVPHFKGGVCSRDERIGSIVRTLSVWRM